MRFVCLASLVALVGLTGCASIVNGQNQSISVETRADSGAVNGASCKLSNNKGTWYVTTPGSTIVNRSYEDLAVRCEKAELEPGHGSFKSSTKGMAFGNILFGGIIGAGVDMHTGAAYDYPTLLTIVMGTSAKAAPPVPAATTSPAASPPVAPTPTPTSAAVPPAISSDAKPTLVSSPPTITKSGVDAYVAQRLAREASCSTDPLAVLLAKGPGYEAYSVTCSNRDVLMIRCEMGTCRAMK